MRIKGVLSEHEKKIIGFSKEEFTNYMLSNYPELFKQYHKSPKETCMCWGFDIGKGWYYILDSLCGKLYELYKSTGYICQFDQIKEKFGGARFYYTIKKKENIFQRIFYKFFKRKDSKIPSIIDDLVSTAEDYCDYVDDYTGSSCDPDDKIVVGSWHYGCTKEGYMKQIEDEKSPAFKESMEKNLNIVKTINELKKER